MKINDLQIGDFILDENNNPVVFNGMGCEGRMGSTDRYCMLINTNECCEYEQHFKSLSPIRLTEKFLEHNDFKRKNDRMCLRWNWGDFVYSDNSFDNNIEIDTINGYATYIHIRCQYRGIGMPIEYVHELQHALRLFGLYEKAENLSL